MFGTFASVLARLSYPEIAINKITKLCIDHYTRRLFLHYSETTWRLSDGNSEHKFRLVGQGHHEHSRHNEADLDQMPRKVEIFADHTGSNTMSFHLVTFLDNVVAETCSIGSTYLLQLTITPSLRAS